MGLKNTIIKAVQNNALEFEDFATRCINNKVLNSQTVKFRFLVIPVFGGFQIDSKYSNNPQPNRFIDVEVTVWGKITITLLGKAELRTKDFLKFIDLFNISLRKLVIKTIGSYKESLKPVFNQFGRKIIQLPATATNQEIEKLVLEGFEVQVKNNNNIVCYGVSQIEVDLFYSKKSA